MIRITACLLLLTISACAGDRAYADPRCDGPGRYDAMREGADCSNPPQDGYYISQEDRAVIDMFFCRHPHAELGKDGCVVMLPEDAKARETKSTCEIGYERECDARDHGAHPYTRGGG